MMKRNFKNMYELYKYILENKIEIKSSKLYGPYELVERLFIYSITNDIRYVPRPLRELVSKIRSKEPSFDEWIKERIKNGEGVYNKYFFQPNINDEIEIPENGYKIHIPAPNSLLKEYGEFLSAILEVNGIPFKIVRSEEKYKTLQGTQAGKFVTIYPWLKNNREPQEKSIHRIKAVADYLKSIFHKLVEIDETREIIESAKVPYDEKYAPNVYYRYFDERSDDRKNPLQGKPRLEDIPKLLSKSVTTKKK